MVAAGTWTLRGILRRRAPQDDGQRAEKERRKKERRKKKKKQVPHPPALRAYGLRMTPKSDCDRQRQRQRQKPEAEAEAEAEAKAKAKAKGKGRGRLLKLARAEGSFVALLLSMTAWGGRCYSPSTFPQRRVHRRLIQELLAWRAHLLVIRKLLEALLWQLRRSE